MNASDQEPRIVRHIAAGEICCDPQWEAAYERFESAEQEIHKFMRRLRGFGLDRRPKSLRVVELFCGRGGGLVALEKLGFSNIEGVDLSESLLQQYRGPATLHLADCRELPLGNASFDAVIVHGGLHHLPRLPADLEAVLGEVQRILHPQGVFYFVEPWLTPFLRFVHTVVEHPWIRKVYTQGDALAVMIERERVTYEQWLGQPDCVREMLRRYFVVRQEKTRWGKLAFAGTPR